ncbi:MAG: ABC transporter ATP-binding protein/permease [Anaerolineae bacterium]|nr:ABC transporter ATP-binding protein/permease [Anaerolineae bacterium]NUQ05887.1 ABC transporter ATP-binding protein [Anaerolineae bacterium]
MAHRSEFTVASAYPYNRRSAVRWILSHVGRYKLLLIGIAVFYLIAWSAYSYGRVLIGAAAGEILNPTDGGLARVALTILLVLMIDSISALIASLSLQTVGQRLERDSREELYTSLLGKSQTFHDRQRVGDIMARATDDVQMMNGMINPGVLFIFETVLGIVVPLFWIATVRVELLLVPLIFVGTYIVTVRAYSRRLNPVVGNQRMAFGMMNAGLEETISGIEVVKASAQEMFERRKFRDNAKRFRDYFAQQGRIEAGYLPTLFYAFAMGLGFLHCMVLYGQGTLTLPDVIAVTGLLATLRFPIFISIFSFSLVQLGIASAERVLKIINDEADLDENAGGYHETMRGEIVFENVSFGYEDGMVLEDVSFHVKPGETIAIVGQTGSGKSTLTDLINRTYDVTAGRILIDGMDVREWGMAALRSQISKIEQDVFLFSRTLAENIAFGAPDTPQAEIERAAHEAQAHDFITSFKDGYQTMVGERGVTLSGGQRQRIALARAFLTNPRILILDDSTSAIDSATEDEIQKAIRRAQQGRTTLLITHRLSQIRWADHILLLEDGRVTAYGNHESLLRKSAQYRRIFARYDVELPPLEAA